MLPAIARFVDELRREGVAASPAELLDAARAVEAVGLEDRARFRAALEATLAKDRREGEVFRRVFDRFFVPPSRAPREAKGEHGAAGSGGQRRTGLGPPSRSRPRPTAEPPPIAAARDGVRAARRDRAGRRGRDELRRVLDAIASRSPGRSGRLRRAEISADPRSGDPLRRRLMGPMTRDEEAALMKAIPRVVEALRLRSGRRMKASRRGRLSVRSLFRRSVRSAGVPFVLPWRRPRPRPTRVVLLVDVSWSVARAAGCFLRLSTEFLTPGRRARVVAFVDRPVDATEAIRRWGRARHRRLGTAPIAPKRRRRAGRPGEAIVRSGESFADVLDRLPGLNLDAPSDYGRAFHGLLRSTLRPAGRDTILLILGDARTNVFDPLPWTLEEIARGTRAVIWLVPEPESRWGTGDSALADYLPSVDVLVETSDLAGLARGVAHLLRRL